MKRRGVEVQMTVLIAEEYLPEDVPIETAGRTRAMELLQDMEQAGWLIEAWRIGEAKETEFDDGIEGGGCDGSGAGVGAGVGAGGGGAGSGA